MTTEKPLPEWLHVGAELTILTGTGSWTHSTDVSVTKILKRDIVLSNGDRFSRQYINHWQDDAVYRRGPGRWTSPSYLMRRDDPRVIKAREDEVEDRAVTKVVRAHKSWMNNRSSNETLQELADAVHALQELRAGR